MAKKKKGFRLSKTELYSPKYLVRNPYYPDRWIVLNQYNWPVGMQPPAFFAEDDINRERVLNNVVKEYAAGRGGFRISIDPIERIHLECFSADKAADALSLSPDKIYLYLNWGESDADPVVKQILAPNASYWIYAPTTSEYRKRLQRLYRLVDKSAYETYEKTADLSGVYF